MTTTHELDEHESFWFFEADGGETYACICKCSARLNVHAPDDPGLGADAQTVGEADRWLDNGHLHEPGRITDVYL